MSGQKPQGKDAAKAADYVFGLKVSGRYNGQPVEGSGKIGGMLALRSESDSAFPVQADVRSGTSRVAFVGTVNRPNENGRG
ncbi:Uncharacterized protein involved in outer membrane biogenesis [Cedecea neteri]|uniref:Uncharacterized protein involved in outer membrane biogenesis n=1 Tax=Cedecea neteri TaxID=158822 RepID=A0A2X2T335_9ENTR|nr:Uncharacterized protein involved in outer membrane biogenesis [Cedecea neteri]